jgi:hypothetical protein
MRRRWPTYAAAAFLAASAAVSGYAQASARAPIPSSALVERAKALDGGAIAFEGEAIGDPMPRRGGAWVNLAGETYAIGVWLPPAELEKISRYGSYGMRGDRVRAEGEFQRACPEHGGNLDIHATSISILERGEEIPHPTSPARIAAAGACLAAGLVLFLFWKRRGKGDK